jgi:translation initiation factor eIF-2B subunit epsilon
LLPLCNVPLIEYTLEFLAIAEVEEIFIFCKAHAEKIRSYIASSKWKHSSIRIHTFFSPAANGVGDILRELDSKGLIQTDFILVHGDVVSNMKLEKVLKEHEKRRAQSKSSIMTIVMKRASPHHKTRAKGEGSVVVLDPANDQCLMFSIMPRYPVKFKLEVDPEMLKGRPAVQIHNDLLDCQIDICSPDVPALFTENFDYQDIRVDFVSGILTSDLLEQTIHVHVIDDEYAARVRSTQMYDAISKDVISRWVYPLVLESNIVENGTYRYYRNHVYREDDVVLARSSKLKKNVVIGTHTMVGDLSEIFNSTIGKYCKIGSGVIIENSYVWNNVVIEDGCKVSNSIIADGVILKKGTVVSRGSILSYNVIVGPNVVLPKFTKLTTTPPNIINEEYPGQLSFDLGTQGVGYLYNDAMEEDIASSDIDERNKLVREIGFKEEDVMHLEEDNVYDGSSEEESDVYYEEFKCLEEVEMERHIAEVKDTMRRAIDENHTVENCVLELNALKMACNITFHDLRGGFLPVILESIDLTNLQKSTLSTFSKWKDLLRRFSGSLIDKVDLLSVLSESCIQMENAVLFKIILTNLYDEDIVAEEAIEQWLDSLEEDFGNETAKKVVYLGRKFLEWLNEDEEE